MSVRAAGLAAVLGVGSGVVAVTAAAPVADVPGRAVAAYTAAAAGSGCGLDWRDLAGIGRVEGGHGSHGGAILDVVSGRVDRIVGPALDGSGVGGNTSPWWDTDRGRWDGDVVYDRAVGPMQFIPATWATVGVDGDGDGVADPHDLDDAAASAAALLCRTGYASDRGAAVEAYNGTGPNARWYRGEVLAYAAGLPAVVSSGGGPVPAVPAGRAGVTGRVLDATVGWAVDAFHRLVGRVEDAPPALTALDKAAQAAAYGQPARPVAPVPVETVGGVVCPVPRPRVGDGWGAPRSGYAHQGVDVGSAGGAGSPVVAPWPGVVFAAVDEADGGRLGAYVGLRRPDGAEVLLGHNQSNDVKVGQTVRAGERVGTLGSSGNADSADPHVHVQWYPAGSAVPAPPVEIEAACVAVEAKEQGL